MSLQLRFAARSDVGLAREGNEDAMYAGPRLLAVADGMGGHAAGEVASRVVIEALAPLDGSPPSGELTDALRQAVEGANGYLRDMVAADGALEGMGTTLTALLWVHQQLGLVHIGDSRAYLLRDGTLQQVTHDHTLVQTLIDQGRITPDEANTHPQRSWITNALDGRTDITLDLSIRDVQAGDRYLVCSDGLSGYVSEQTIAEVLRTGDPQDACDQLVDLALRAGGLDNVTCVVADLVDAQPAGDDPIVGGAAAGGPADNDPALDSPATRAAAIQQRSRRASSAASADATAPAAPRARDERSRGARRVGFVLLGVVLLVVAGVVTAVLYARTQYYVAVTNGTPATVGIYRGVAGDVAGIDLSKLADRTDLPVSALSSYDRQRVGDGIQADNHADALRIVATLRNDACAVATPTPRATPSPSAARRKSGSRHRSSAPKPAPSPPPPYCTGGSS